MKAFAGSSGDPNAPQLIVDNRAVTLEYAREFNRSVSSGSGGSASIYGNGGGREDDRDRGDDRKPIKCDWLCDACGCQNFARRTECYRCSVPRSETSVLINSADPYADAAVISPTPTAILVVRGLNMYTTEEQVMEAFRQYAVVTSARIVRDRTSGVSKGLAFVEFPSVEYATHTLQQATTTSLQIDKMTVKVSYAREMVAQTAAMLPGPPMLPSNTYAVAALQAAQWVANNGYANRPVPLPPTPAPGKLGAIHRSATSGAGLAPKQKPKWPPRFETHGAAYVFQPQTGMFLEPISEYYYCPKSKLYYNAMDGIYYRATLAVSAELIPEESSFLRFDPPVPIGEDDSKSKNTEDQQSLSKLKDTASRKPIVMSLGGGFGKSKTVIATKKETCLPTSVSSKAVEDGVVGLTTAFGKTTAESQAKIAKWGQANREPDAPAAASTIVNHPVPTSLLTEPQPVSITNTSLTNVMIDSTSAFTVSTKATGGSVCLICRRQFASPEMLLRHEKESKLHAENVAKQLSNASTASTSKESVTYRDRASERRELHGQSSEPPPLYSGRRRSRSRSRERSRRPAPTHENDAYATSTSNSTSTAPKLSEDDTNTGNQLLRKLGWQDGKGLGKDGSGIKDPIGLKGAQGDSSKTGLGSTNIVIPPVEYGEGRVYKDSLLRAARARYEMVERDEDKGRKT